MVNLGTEGELRQPLEDADEDVLGQIFGERPLAGQAVDVVVNRDLVVPHDRGERALVATLSLAEDGRIGLWKRHSSTLAPFRTNSLAGQELQEILTAPSIYAAGGRRSRVGNSLATAGRPGRRLRSSQTDRCRGWARHSSGTNGRPRGRRATSPRRDLVEVAARLEIGSLGLCDRNGLYGAVGFIEAARKAGIRPVVGVELDLVDARRIRLLARGRRGYPQLCRAISAAQLAGVKGQPRLRITGLTDEEPDGDGELALDAGGRSLEEEAWVRAERRFAAGSRCNAAETSSPIDSQGDRTRGPRSTTPAAPPSPPHDPPAVPPASAPTTSGPFPEGWPSLPSTRDRVETPPAVVDPPTSMTASRWPADRRAPWSPPSSPGTARSPAPRRALRECFGRDRAALLLTNHLHPADRWLAAEVAELG